MLATTFPALPEAAAAVPADRHQLHRAVRALLERLAAPRGLVLLLDDLHWADPASIALVASLVRRPSSSRLLLAVAHRDRQVGSALDPELRRAADAGLARRLTPGPLTTDEASRLLDRPSSDQELRRLYAESGGNPFHLMQLARADAAPRPAIARDRDPGYAEVPEAVREAVLSETAPLPPDARALLDGAAILGDPFEINFAIEVAGLDREAALVALDELVAADLISVTDEPRRFRFRHPIVRRTVYETVGPGRRLAGHARAAAGLERAGAGAAAVAHHVEQSAAPGDAAAVALLAEAAAQVAGRAPQTAVHWLTVARGLVQGPDRAQLQAPLLGPLAGALAGAGRFDDARRVLLELLVPLPEDSPARTGLIVGCAAMDRLLGDHEGGRTRLRAARAALADPGSPDAVALGIELAAHASLAGDPLEMRVCATEALAGATALGDQALMAAATAALAMAAYTLGHMDEGRARGRDAALLVAKLDDEQLGAAVGHAALPRLGGVLPRGVRARLGALRARLRDRPPRRQRRTGARADGRRGTQPARPRSHRRGARRRRRRGRGRPAARQRPVARVGAVRADDGARGRRRPGRGGAGRRGGGRAGRRARAVLDRRRLRLGARGGARRHRRGAARDQRPARVAGRSGPAALLRRPARKLLRAARAGRAARRRCDGRGGLGGTRRDRRADLRPTAGRRLGAARAGARSPDRRHRARAAGEAAMRAARPNSR